MSSKTKSFETKVTAPLRQRSHGNAAVVLITFGVLLSGVLMHRIHTYSQDPYIFMLPNALLLTPFWRLSSLMWKITIPLAMDKSVIYEPTGIHEMQASEFSYEHMKNITNNFSEPAVFRGLFSNSTAVNKWTHPGYMSGKIGNVGVHSVAKTFTARAMADETNGLSLTEQIRFGKTMRNISHLPFGETYDEIMGDKTSPRYILFPLKHHDIPFRRTTMSDFDRNMAEAANKIVYEDLDLDLIWPGFSYSDRHASSRGTQLIIGQSRTNEHNSVASTTTTGLGWHCEMGNNWFVQIAGVKRWFLASPKYSAYFFPMRAAPHALASSALNMAELTQFFPTQYVDLTPGDLFYNPDWGWHSTANQKGLSIGVTLRESNMTQSFKANFQYSAIVLQNKLLRSVGLDVGYPTKYE
jgi:hypothetical protein